MLTYHKYAALLRFEAPARNYFCDRVILRLQKVCEFVASHATTKSATLPGALCCSNAYVP
ncbi:MAG: hypothetical protein LBF72_01100 [Holosporales bacterium]|nr:hypothetical protein [Holosporales bacterium]